MLTLAEAVRAIYPRLVLDVETADIQRALKAWQWLEPPDCDVALVSKFGDMFYDTPQGVVMLDTLEGSLNIVAANSGDFVHALAGDDYRDEVLSDVWVQAAAHKGIVLSSGECFDWAVAPILGGSCASEAITKGSFVVKVAIAGQIHHQVKV